jgi:starch synthase
MIAMRYGTVPVVRRTGGLADTVQDYDPATGQGSGFVFEEHDPTPLAVAIGRALAAYHDRPAWQQLVAHDMGLDWSWPTSARKYVSLYQQAQAFRRAEGA